MSDTDSEKGTEVCTCKSVHSVLLTNDRISLIAAVLVAAILVAINIPRLYESNFWGDEALSIIKAKQSFSEIIIYSRDIDAHPPLFNLMLSFMTKVFGTSPFVYHMVPFIPYVGILLISVFFIRKHFGVLVAISFMLLATFLDTATYYIPEVRMYELGAFFVLASYVSTYLVLKNGDNRSYTLLVVSSLCAAYTHYYCLMAVCLLYAGLFLYYVLKKDRTSLKRYLIFASITVLGYLPWIIASFIKTMLRVTDIFWIQESLSLEKAISFIFGNSGHVYVLLTVFLLIIVYVIFRFVWNRYRGESSEKKDDNKVVVWIVLGLFCVIGSVALALLISSMTRPLIYDRYLYPVSVISWLILVLGVSLITSKKKYRTLLSVLVIVIILVVCVPDYCETIRVEQERNELTAEVVDLTYDYLSEGDNIVTNMDHMKSLWQIYFPDLTWSYINEYTKKVPKLSHSCNNLMFLTDQVQLSDIEGQINSQGYDAVLIKSEWFAKKYYVDIYELRPI